MKIGLIDVDGHNFPNLPLMKLSAYHKRKGDAVEWYNPLLAWKYPYDRVYMSKVFTFTPDYRSEELKYWGITNGLETIVNLSAMKKMHVFA